MDKLKVGLVGAGGRMGKAITQVLSHSPKSKLTSAIVRKGSVFEGLDSGLHSGVNSENHIPYTSDLDKELVNADVWIDFSTQSSFSENISLFQKHKKPVVIGTTGLNASQKEEIRSASQHIPIVFSPNMSVGVNLLFKLTEIAAKALKDYDIEVLDIHHRHKKDSPSGTTEKLKDVLLRSLYRTEDEVIYGRHGIYPERPSSEVGIHTMRAGEVVGEHTVFFFSPEERIEITHRAQDRKTFAVGSVKAAEFLKDAKPSLYDMFDVLGI